MMDVVSKYLAAHQEHHDQPGYSLVRQALAEAYPCAPQH